MLNEFLTPVSEELFSLASQLDDFSIGAHLQFHTELQENALVILGVKENRGGFLDNEVDFSLDGIRTQFYQLKKGNWHLPVFDLGDLNPGLTLEDTYYAFEQIQREVLQAKAHLIILGGTADLAYGQYRVFDSITHQVSLSSIDNRFRLGNDAEELSIHNYLSKIITIEPHQLFDYHQMGYQTYFVAQEELDLMEQLNFDVKRLGKLMESIEEAEPELRHSDLVVLNLEAIQSSDFQSANTLSPNGFSSREICALVRYAGINNKVRSLGVYNYKPKHLLSDDLLVAEMMWYFIEGKNQAPMALNFEDQTSYQTYYVQLDERSLIFYHDIQAQQWWLELNEMEEIEMQGKQITPCSLKDYENALKGKIPDRWWKSYKKLY
ncbi:MAG TPA: formimidoylglutamase [Moheibacter sp.]|nr:formimidoylglutamase [Moheibacter sp.]